MINSFYNKYLAVLCFSLFLIFGCSSDEKKKEVFLSDGKAYFEKQEYSKAVIQLKNVIKIDPRSIEAYTLLSEIHLKTGKSREAFSVLLKLEQLEPENMETKLKLATFYLLGKQVFETQSRVDYVLSKEPDNIEALYLHAGILSYKKEELKKIKEVYNKILEIDPEHIKAYMALSKIYAFQNNYKKAEENIKVALKLNPDNININKALMELYLSQKDIDAAEDVLENLVKIKPDDSAPLIMLGNFYLSRKNNTLAETAFLKAIEKNPESISLYLILARYYNGIKKTQKAEQYILKALKIDPEHAGLKSAYADFHFSKQNFDKAEILVDEVLTKRPDYIPAKLLKGKILSQKKEYNKAIQIFQELVKEEPDSQVYNFLLGRTLIQKGDQKRALPYISKTLDVNSDHYPARMIMADIHYGKADYFLAETQVKGILKSLPYHYDANILLGNIYTARKNFDSAEELFKNMILLAPENPNAYFRMGVVKRLEKDNESAKEYFEKALKINPNLMDVFTSLIGVYTYQKQFDKAVERCDIQMTVTGDNPVIKSILHNLKGDLLLYLNKIDQAKKEFEMSIRKNPKFVTPYFTMAKIFKLSKQTDKEIETYKALIRNRNDQPSPHDCLGTIYEKQGKYDLAQTHYKKAIEINPEYIPAMNNLAFLYAEQNQELNKAIDLARNAREKAGNIPAIIDTLGWVYYKKELYESAVREFKICVEKEPANPIFLYHSGLAYYKVGEYVKAEEALKKALELKSDFRGSDEAKKVLKQL